MKTVYNGEMDPRSFKDVLGSLIPALCTEREDVIYLDADLMSCIGTAKWGKEHPERAINCGVAEANMIGVACGLAAAGFRPIAHSFGTFASRRCFDQAFLSAGYAGNDMTIIGSDPGVTAAYNGGTHMPFEDMALFRAIPSATVIDITDTAMLESVLRECLDRPGLKYIRTPRKSAARVFAEGEKIPIGPAIVLREGRDAVIFAAGIMVHEAMQAALALEKEGLSIAVVNVFTVKPLDEETVAAYAGKTGAVVTAENHNRIGGLFSAVADCLARRRPTPIECVAVEDVYGEVGPQPYLQAQFGLTSERVLRAVKDVLARK
ncbi:MAG: transketolase C-terminal domain-containing protein [Clostridia bacterium]|nr:transketolase C-terminal domain-containing protein [Clostridia bacterium]